MKPNILKFIFIFVLLTLFSFQINAKSPITSFNNMYSLKVIQPDKVISLPQVVVSSIENANRITWYKQPNASIEYYNINRKNISETDSDWICIGKVNYDDDAMFLDITAKFISNNIYDYRVSCVNPCGNELFSDLIAQPINLKIETTLEGKNNKLVFNPYKGMDVKKYYILSGVLEDQLGIIDSIDSNITSYVDKNHSDNIYYQIIAVGEIKNEITEDITNVQVYSNKASLSFHGINKKKDDKNIMVLSDYINNKSLIVFLGFRGEKYKATIFDLSGRPVYNNTFNSETFEISHNLFHKGIYILQIENVGKKDSVKLKI